MLIPHTPTPSSLTPYLQFSNLNVLHLVPPHVFFPRHPLFSSSPSYFLSCFIATFLASLGFPLSFSHPTSLSFLPTAAFFFTPVSISYLTPPHPHPHHPPPPPLLPSPSSPPPPCLFFLLPALSQDTNLTHGLLISESNTQTCSRRRAHKSAR